jgi:sterol desaturase/sphingolipid hydroxylase (fatty acid hydroxylase superfamily)
MHRVHHSPVREQTNSNYSSFLTIWDRLFFTFSASSDTAQQPPLGLNEFRSDEWQSVSGMLRTPFVGEQTNKPDAQGFSSEQPE